MKKYLNYISKSVLAVAVLFFASCEEGDQVFDEIIDNVERGAVLRTVELTSNELPIGKPDAQFAATLEAQSQEDGDNVTQIEVYVGFRDNTVEEGETDKDVAEALFNTIPASEFYQGEFGYPRVDVSIPLSEMLNFTGVTEDDLFGGDQFEVRFELVLDDGRRFSFADNSGTLTGSFFSSPFLYTPTVVCPVESDMFVGQYRLESVVDGPFGPTFGNDVIVELSIGETSTQRVFEAVFLPSFPFGQPPVEFKFDLVCETITVPDGQAMNLACAAAPMHLGNPGGAVIGSYDKSDDTTLVIYYQEDQLTSCNAPSDAAIRLTKI